VIGDRKVKFLTVPQSWGGRDAGKVFKLTERDAFTAESWAWRLKFVVKGLNGHIPMEVAKYGYVGVTIALLNAILVSDIDPSKFMPLLDEMLDCVEVIRDPNAKDRTTGDLIATKLLRSDISEVKTIGWIRSEIIELHSGFSPAAVLSESISAIRAAAAMREKEEKESATTVAPDDTSNT